MFNRTIVGDGAPVHLLDNPAADHRRPRLVPAHTEIVFQRGARAHALRVVHGCIALYQVLEDDRRQILDILGPGRLLRADLVDLQHCRAAALVPTEVETVGTREKAAAQDDILRHMLGRAQAHAMLLGRKQAVERVATAILDLASQFARKQRGMRSGGTTFTLYLTRTDIADWLGLTLETVSRCFGALKRANLIAFDQPELVTILDHAALEALARGRGTV